MLESGYLRLQALSEGCSSLRVKSAQFVGPLAVGVGCDDIGRPEAWQRVACPGANVLQREGAHTDNRSGGHRPKLGSPTWRQSTDDSSPKTTPTEGGEKSLLVFGLVLGSKDNVPSSISQGLSSHISARGCNSSETFSRDCHHTGRLGEVLESRLWRY